MGTLSDCRSAVSRAWLSLSFRLTTWRQDSTRPESPAGSASATWRRMTPMWPQSPRASGRLRPSSTGSESTITTLAASAKLGGRP